MSFAVILENIRLFKLSNKLEEQEYNNIFALFDKLYKKKNKLLGGFFIENEEKILEEKNNFRYYIF